MRIDEIHKLNVALLSNWEKELTRGHFTPLILIGVGNDHSKDKMKTICLEGVSNEQLFTILSTLRDELAARMSAKPTRFLDLIN